MQHLHTTTRLVTTATLLVAAFAASAQQPPASGAMPSNVAANVPTVEEAGVRFPVSLPLGGSTLQLNGHGIRYKAIFKVYAAGLYMGTKASTPDAAINAPGPKRIQLVMLRTLDANEFGKILSAGIEKNATPQEFIQMLVPLAQMGDAAARVKVLQPGDSLTIDWVPNVGGSLYVKGKLEGGPYKDPAFFSAMLKIWLGKSPADSQLKDALLGTQRQYGM